MQVTYEILPTAELCTNCLHFYQHYIYSTVPFKNSIYGFSAIHDGHCCYPRVKNRKPTDTCKHFECKNQIIQEQKHERINKSEI